MANDHIMSRLEVEIEKTVSSAQTIRNVGVNGCRQIQSLTAMELASPTLMFPIIGRKRLFVAQQCYDACPGEVLVVPAGTRFDLENIPDFARQRFLGAALVFDAETLAFFHKVYGGDMKNWSLTPQWKAAGSDELLSSISDWVAHDRQFSSGATQTRHRLAEILLTLAHRGMAGNILFSQQSGLRERIKHLIGLNPGHEWRMPEITQKLAMSESTLRRQLRAENTSFRELLEDTRLGRGIELVMMTDMPVGQIAFECGYQSQSRFSERFRLRFSLSPTEFRATQAQPAGSVVELDQFRSIS